MLNPITEKLRKINTKNKRCRAKLPTQPDTPLRPFSRSFLPDKENDPLTANSLNHSALQVSPWKSFTLRKPQYSQLKHQDYQQVLKDNQRLKEMVKTHELMEEFYLKELELRRKEKSNLEWRLQVLNEEIQNSTVKRCPKQSQILLRERVQAARKGLEAPTQQAQ